MWGYYGAKTNVIKHYPKPKHDLIIEPFAGTARYSLRFFEHDIHLIDKYEVVIKIWHWLQQCSEKDVLSLPRLQPGDKVADAKIGAEGAELLIGFMCGYATSAPRKTMTSVKLRDRPNFLEFTYKRIASNLFKIRHWKIECGDYQDVPNQRATWFIDPPYQKGGAYYKHNKMNFDHLRPWSMEREGQVIVCEGIGADWMDFTPIKRQKTTRGYNTEVIWTNELISHVGKQETLLL